MNNFWFVMHIERKTENDTAAEAHKAERLYWAVMVSQM